MIDDPSAFDQARGAIIESLGLDAFFRGDTDPPQARLRPKFVPSAVHLQLAARAAQRRRRLGISEHGLYLAREVVERARALGLEDATGETVHE